VQHGGPRRRVGFRFKRALLSGGRQGVQGKPKNFCAPSWILLCIRTDRANTFVWSAFDTSHGIGSISGRTCAKIDDRRKTFVLRHELALSHTIHAQPTQQLSLSRFHTHTHDGKLCSAQRKSTRWLHTLHSARTVHALGARRLLSDHEGAESMFGNSLHYRQCATLRVRGVARDGNFSGAVH
jgi:hypothetical protein